MSPLRYFKASSDTTKLPDPCDPLSTTVPSSSIESANGRNEALIDENEATMRRFQIGKHAAETDGVVATMHFYAKKFVLKESRCTTAEFTHLVRGRVNQVLWAEQFWIGHPRKLDREIFEDCPSAKIGPFENFPLYST